MRIAVDGMGGDRAPQVIVEGAVEAAIEYGCRVIIIGQEKLIYEELNKFVPYPDSIEVRHASEVVEMHDPPAITIRRKKDSSINVAINLAKNNEADAIVTAGNTGAAVCSTTLGLRLLERVERPGIGVVMPTLKGTTILLDAGANIDPKPVHLFQYAIMGDVYSKHILHKEHPKVGLLNIGEEETKGSEIIKETYKLLEQSELSFMGNVEGRNIFDGSCDVVVCDGLVGNVVLKVAESLAGIIGKLLRRELSKSPITRLGAVLSNSAFSAIRKEIDYAEYGGAPLLGINGICIIGHGSSSAKAIKNAIRVAMEAVNHQVNQHIVEAIAKKSQIQNLHPQSHK